MFSQLMSMVLTEDFLFSIIRITAPILFAALGAVVAEKAGVTNIGLEGTMMISALLGMLVSYWTQSWVLGVLAAIVVGILLGLMMGFFYLKLKTDIILAGIAVNMLGGGGTIFLLYMFTGMRGNTGALSSANILIPTINIPLIDRIPFVGKVLSGHSIFVYVTWLLVFLMWLFVYRTPRGLWIRASGESPETLRTVGKNPERMKWIASILCGVFCGLAGAHLSLGYLNGSFVEGMSASRGYIAFACVIFAAANPPRAYIAALMFGFFDALGLRLQSYVNSDLTGTIPYLITIIMMVYVVVRKQQRKKKLAKQEA